MVKVKKKLSMSQSNLLLKYWD